MKCELYDFTRLKEYYIRSQSLELSGPAEVVLRLPTGQFFQKDKPFPTLVAVVKGNELRNLYQRHKESLYTWNIRGYLGNRGINKSIFDTASRNADYFFYYNNGVSAICTSYEFRADNELLIKGFQVINGAQTISTLAKAEPNSDIDILFRLTRTASVKTEKGFTREIVQYNNSQNVVRVSDFRSNDPIQLWLESRFKDLHSKVLPSVFYLRKRSVGRKGTGHGIRLEDLAKIRYAFLYEPTLIHAAPKRLWSTKDEDAEGEYEKSFGVQGELEVAWSDETFDECLLALAFYFRIESEVASAVAADSSLRFLKRLRYHALSLAGHYYRDGLSHPSAKHLLESTKEFEVAWSGFWSRTAPILIDVYGWEEQKTTMFAFVRSTEKWEQITKSFKRRLTLGV